MLRPYDSQAFSYGIPDYLRSGILNLLAAIGVSSTLTIDIGMPVIVVNNGTVATNGTITLGTALPAIYADAWIYLPAGAVVGGLAGLYYCQFSSTTVGVIKTGPGADVGFQAAATPFVPYRPIPANIAAVTGSNAGYTQTTGSDLTLLYINIPANFMGLNGLLRIDMLPINNNTAGNKIAKLKFGAATLDSVTSTTGVAANEIVTVRNRGIAAGQVVHTRNIADAAIASALSYTTVNTAVDNALLVTGQLATATDHLVLEGFTLEAAYS